MQSIHNHSVDGSNEGLRALRQLDSKEAEVIFDYAEEKGSADFEAMIDNKRMNFTLIRKSGSWIVENRGKEKSKGWFGW